MKTFANPHDLLELSSSHYVENLASSPEWVRKSLSDCSFVVVRRKPAPPKQVAIGVRGATRNKRWAGTVDSDGIRAVIRPFEIRTTQHKNKLRTDALPAFRYLKRLESLWSSLEFQWGPGGSVGFELATGCPAANESSDLDIILFAPRSFSHEYAKELFLSVCDISPNSIDVLVEAPDCAFSLREYAHAEANSFLLRTYDEPVLGKDPWSFAPAERSAYENCS
jgi:phosphoribosyl-dephospho-CoA transferase